MKTCHFYAYLDQYGWTVATVTGAPSAAFAAAWNSPRTFATRADAEAWISTVCA